MSKEQRTSYVTSPTVETVVKTATREFRLFFHRVMDDTPLSPSEMRRIVYHVSMFTLSPQDRDMAVVRAAALALAPVQVPSYVADAMAEIYRRAEKEELVGQRNSPYHFSFRDDLGRWDHYQAYEVP